MACKLSLSESGYVSDLTPILPEKQMHTSITRGQLCSDNGELPFGSATMQDDRSSKKIMKQLLENQSSNDESIISSTDTKNSSSWNTSFKPFLTSSLSKELPCSLISSTPMPHASNTRPLTLKFSNEIAPSVSRSACIASLSPMTVMSKASSSSVGTTSCPNTPSILRIKFSAQTPCDSGLYTSDYFSSGSLISELSQSQVTPLEKTSLSPKEILSSTSLNIFCPVTTSSKILNTPSCILKSYSSDETNGINLLYSSKSSVKSLECNKYSLEEQYKIKQLEVSSNFINKDVCSYNSLDTNKKLLSNKDILVKEQDLSQGKLQHFNVKTEFDVNNSSGYNSGSSLQVSSPSYSSSQLKWISNRTIDQKVYNSLSPSNSSYSRSISMPDLSPTKLVKSCLLQSSKGLYTSKENILSTTLDNKSVNIECPQSSISSREVSRNKEYALKYHEAEKSIDQKCEEPSNSVRRNLCLNGFNRDVLLDCEIENNVKCNANDNLFSKINNQCSSRKILVSDSTKSDISESNTGESEVKQVIEKNLKVLVDKHISSNSSAKRIPFSTKCNNIVRNPTQIVEHKTKRENHGKENGAFSKENNTHCRESGAPRKVSDIPLLERNQSNVLVLLMDLAPYLLCCVLGHLKPR